MVKNSRKRWLILTQYYPPEIGAPQIRLHAMARELQQAGIDVEVLTAIPNYPIGKIFPGYQNRLMLNEQIDGIQVKRVWIYAANGKSARIRLLNYLSFTFAALVVTLIRRRPDVLFVESQPLSLGFIAILMKWLRRVPYIYNVPDLQVDVARQLGFMKNETFLQIALRLENYFLRSSWKVSTVTQRFISHFQSRGLCREQLSFLPNGADSTFLCPGPQDNEMLNRWGLHNKKVFLYVGTHAYYHGLDTLIHAAKLLQDRNDIAFLMIGNGPERERIMKLAENLKLNNIVFGQSPYEEMDRLYSITYASIAMLRDMAVAENMRLSKIFPALSCGVPVIYAGFGEAATLIENKSCGIALEPENAKLLAQTIRELADNQTARDDMGHAGRKWVMSEYNWSIIIKKWLEELELTDVQAN